jgi:hypothetical protein
MRRPPLFRFLSVSFRFVFFLNLVECAHGGYPNNKKYYNIYIDLGAVQ